MSGLGSKIPAVNPAAVHPAPCTLNLRDCRIRGDCLCKPMHWIFGGYCIVDSVFLTLLDKPHDHGVPSADLTLAWAALQKTKIKN